MYQCICTMHVCCVCRLSLCVSVSVCIHAETSTTTGFSVQLIVVQKHFSYQIFDAIRIFNKANMFIISVIYTQGCSHSGHQLSTAIITQYHYKLTDHAVVKYLHE